MNVCEKRATKAVNGVIQTWERQHRESCTIGSRDKMLGELEMRRVKYGGEGRQIARCHKHEQMAETGVGKSEKRERGSEGER